MAAQWAARCIVAAMCLGLGIGVAATSPNDFTYASTAEDMTAHRQLDWLPDSISTHSTLWRLIIVIAICCCRAITRRCCGNLCGVELKIVLRTVVLVVIR